MKRQTTKVLKPNKFGKYKKDEILEAGYTIIDYGFTATDIKKMTGVNLLQEQRLKYCIGFKTTPGSRGYVPVFDPNDIYKHLETGELRSSKL